MQPSENLHIRVLIVDDHHVVRLGLRALLDRHAGFEVIGEAGTVAAAVEEAKRLHPDVVLLDVRLPDGKGYEACRQIHQLLPDVRILFLTSFADEQTVLESLDAGGDGYLLKEIDEAALVQGIRSVANGQSILDPTITRRVLERAKRSGAPTGEAKWATLSPQEKRILSLVAQGETD